MSAIISIDTPSVKGKLGLSYESVFDASELSRDIEWRGLSNITSLENTAISCLISYGGGVATHQLGSSSVKVWITRVEKGGACLMLKHDLLSGEILALASKGRYLVLIGKDGLLSLVNLISGICTARIPLPISNIASAAISVEISVSSRSIFVASERDSKIYVFSIPMLAEGISGFDEIDVSAGGPRSMVMSASGILYVACRGGTVLAGYAASDASGGFVACGYAVSRRPLFGTLYERSWDEGVFAVSAAAGCLSVVDGIKSNAGTARIVGVHDFPLIESLVRSPLGGGFYAISKAIGVVYMFEFGSTGLPVLSGLMEAPDQIQWAIAKGASEIIIGCRGGLVLDAVFHHRHAS